MKQNLMGDVFATNSRSMRDRGDEERGSQKDLEDQK